MASSLDEPVGRAQFAGLAVLRQYMPKSTDLSAHSAADLDRFATSLNNRPRKTLGYMKSSEKLTELLALTG